MSLNEPLWSPVQISRLDTRDVTHMMALTGISKGDNVGAI